MDAIEKAVRNALEKGDAEDNNYRRRVYVSARSALEKSMAGKTLTQEIVDQRFLRLSEIAAIIEAEFAPAAEDFEYPLPHRRSYEAPPPVVDEAPETSEDIQVVSHAPPADAMGDPALAGVDAFAQSEADSEPRSEPDSQASAKPQPEAGPDAVAEPTSEVSSPNAGLDEAVEPQPRKRKSQSRKNTRILTPVVAEPEAPPPDLFQSGEPVWDEVVMPAAREPGAADEDRSESEAMDRPASAPQEAGAEPHVSSPDEAHESHGMLDMFAGASETASEPAGPAPQEMEAQPAAEVADDDLAETDVHEAAVLGDSIVGSDSAELADTPRALADSDLASPVLEDEPHFEVRPLPADDQAGVQARNPSDNLLTSSQEEPRRGWAFLFILVTLLAFLIMGLWFAYTTGTLKLRGAVDAPTEDVLSVAPQDEPSPAKPDAAIPAATAPDNDWLMIFRPDNPGDLVVDPTIKADVAGTGPLAHLRIEPAASSGTDASVVFSIGKGILEQIAGKKAVFDIVAAADDNNPTQISVLCDFAGLGDCGRKRYRIDAAASDNLFQIEFPEGAPDGDGQVIINPDVDGKGRSLEIYAIKVRIAEN